MFRLVVGLLSVGCLMFASLQAEDFPTFDQLPSVKALPDPLTMRDGSKVASAEDWWKKRRPELKGLIEHYMYGVPPAGPHNVSGVVGYTDDKALGGKATLREIAVAFGPEGKGKINLLLIVPNKRSGKTPTFVGVNFYGNHQVIADPQIALPTAWVPNGCKGCKDNHASDEGRGGQAEGWSADLIIDRGYALATFYCGDLDPDKNEWTDGVHPLYYKPGQTKPADGEWATIASWAFGVSRAIDYLVTRDDIDPSRLSVIGHSRLGKTALLAGAMDERIAIVYPHQSGTGGCALSRDNDQETVERINRVFPHWFNGNFKHFGKNEDKIPFDQHSLMALCAPRPIFDSEGDQDKWANFDNSFKSLQGASPVYKLLGKQGLKVDRPLAEDEAFTDANVGELVQYRRNEKHEMNRRYWTRMLDFADLHYARTAK